jgi:prepilin-type N-terminal cleavage/methylation domain-containing protein
VLKYRGLERFSNGSILQLFNRSGFSLIELMISMAILTTAILLMAGIFLSAIKTTHKGIDLSSGILVAKSVLSEEIHNIETGASGTTVAELFSQNPLSIVGQKKVGNQTFDYTITRSLLVHAVTGDPIGERLADNGLLKVNVLVSWTDNPTQGSPGQGLQRVGYTELLNQRDLP